MANKNLTAAPAGIGPCLRFRDTRYASRTLILPDGRDLPVVRGEVTAGAGDTQALAWLEKHPDLIPLE